MRSSGVTVVFAAMSSGMEGLLTSHGVIRKTRSDAADEDIVIGTADAALGILRSLCVLILFELFS